MANNPRILVTGASGQLGRLVIASLLKKVPAAQISGLVRKSEAAAELGALGIQTPMGDYLDTAALDAAMAGIDHVLLISGSEVGKRIPQHTNVIEAAKRAGVKRIAYTSILHCDTSPLGLAEEHKGTEATLKASGLPYVLLRNSWYTENYFGNLAGDIERGVIIGCSGNGRISAATRADYAEAGAVVMTTEEDIGGRTYELGGDEAFTMAQFAEELSRQAGKQVVYQDMSEKDYAAALASVGLPDFVAALRANSSAGAAKDGLFDDGKQLSKLIGRPTTPLSQALATALKK